MENTSRFVSLFGTFLVLCSVGCGDDSTVGGDCQPRCEARASVCGAPLSVSSPVCQDICAEATPATVFCLEASSCAELGDAFATGADVCGNVPPPDAGGFDSGPGRDVGAGECDLGASPYCDGNDVVTCERFTGQVATVFTSCGADMCSRGECVPGVCLSAGERDCSSFGDPACCGELSCNQQGDERVCCALDFGCERDRDCCLYQPDFPQASHTCVAGECVFPR